MYRKWKTGYEIKKAREEGRVIAPSKVDTFYAPLTGERCKEIAGELNKKRDTTKQDKEGEIEKVRLGEQPHLVKQHILWKIQRILI